MKFAQIMLKVGNVASGAFLGQPLFADPKSTEPIIPQNTSNKIVAAIATVEHLTSTIDAMKTMTGPEKLAAATALAKDSILMSSALTGGKVKDQTRFDLGSSKIVDGWNDIVKSLESN